MGVGHEDPPPLHSQAPTGDDMSDASQPSSARQLPGESPETPAEPTRFDIPADLPDPRTDPAQDKLRRAQRSYHPSHDQPWGSDAIRPGAGQAAERETADPAAPGGLLGRIRTVVRRGAQPTSKNDEG